METLWNTSFIFFLELDTTLSFYIPLIALTAILEASAVPAKCICGDPFKYNIWKGLRKVLNPEENLC